MAEGCLQLWDSVHFHVESPLWDGIGLSGLSERPEGDWFGGLVLRGKKSITSSMSM